jgi:periplasmic protein TonB
MIDKTEAQRPFARRPSGGGGPAGDQLSAALASERQDRRRLRRAVLAAAGAHLLLFFVVFPRSESPPLKVGSQAPRAYVVQQVRFRPPQPRQQQAIPERKTRKIPIPDPTPDDPEPIREEEIKPAPETPELDASLFDSYFLDNLPPGPPGAGLGPVMQVNGEVLAPEKVFAPTPVYTEEARVSRIQGVVILQAVIDRDGKVADLAVLKGLPGELTERAVDVVKTWRFKPATLHGEPVAVYYNLTISFSLA